MRRRKKNKALRITLIVVAILLLCVGIFCAIYFLSKEKSMKYYEVRLSGNSGNLTLSSNSKKLAPNLEIISRPVTVNITTDSANSFIRAKIIFESDSNDNRVLSFVSQLNYYINETVTHTADDYSWKYSDADNSFYLMSGNSDNLRTVTNKDYNYIFIDKLVVPSLIEQIDSVNSDGDNVQIGEDITLRIAFECIQSELQLNKSAGIENTREYFNNLCYFEENGFTSLNGKIISYNGQDTSLILPKYVENDYIIGVGEDAFNNANIKNVVITGNYIKFDDNAFYNATNLTFVALKNQTKMILSPSSFSANANLSIYSPNSTINFIRQNYSTYNYAVNFKSFVEVSDGNISYIDTNLTYLYAPNVTEFVGDFKNFTNLKVIYAPSLNKINDNMFENLSGLIDVDCPNVLNVGNKSFNGCTSLLNVTFSKKLETIGEYSFSGCNKLTNIAFAKDLKVIPKEAFRGCSKVTKIELNAENLEILSGAFYNISSLKTVNIKSLSKLENYAFGECDSLNYFNLNSVNNLELQNKAFSSSTDSSNIRSITFVTNNENVKNSLLTISNNINCVVISINRNTLTRYNGTVKNLDLTEICRFYNITKIGDSAFKNSSLTSLTLPSKIAEIGNNFVDGALNLVSVTFNSYNPPIMSENCFDNANENLSIYCPNKNVVLYQQIFKGKSFKIIGN